MQLKTILNHVEPHKGFVYGPELLVKGEEAGVRIEVVVRARKGSRPRCSECGKAGPVYDHRPVRRFVFVPLWGIPVFFLYALRRVHCGGCGVRVERVPWAAGKSPITRSLALYLADWAKRLSWQEVARCFGVNWRQVYASVHFVVGWGLRHRDLSAVRALGIDEIQFGKGHQYLTVVYQLCGRAPRLLYVGQRREAASLSAFFALMGQGWCANITHVCTDMWQAYRKAIVAHMPGAVHILDRFHIVKLLNEAVDAVRRLGLAARQAGGPVNPYRDYRYLLEQKDIDAVVIATPDHWHAVQTVHAAQMGKHVYVEKPACCTIEEGTAMIKAARENNISVQVGSQGRSQPEAYLAHRYLENGNIGTVRRVDCFHYPSPIDEDPVPDSEPPEELDWDMWLGPLRWRPYNARYAHSTFRWIMESGGGQIRDRGAHVMSCAMHWLNADGQAPVEIEATGTAPTRGLWDSCVHMNVTYRFENPDWIMTWNQPGDPVPPEDRSEDDVPPITRPGYGAVYQGDQGTFHHWGGDGGTWVERKARQWEPGPGAKEVRKSPGHLQDWFHGIKTGEPTIMNIEASVGVSDLCNLGNLAYLLGRPLKWDGATREIIGDPVANRMLGRPQRYPYCL